MTRAFEGMVSCPKCGHNHTAETAFERWMRNEPDLDSITHGVVRFDCDVLLHRYMYNLEDKKGSRDLQFVMFIEVKTRRAIPTPAQRDTLSMFSQVLRNRKRNIHCDKKGSHAKNHVPPAIVMSHMLKRNVGLRLLGGHLLQMEGIRPNDGQRLWWDYNLIDLKMLVALLRFEVDPDTLKKPDWRRRWSAFPPTGIKQLDLLDGLNP